jgi:hypothetical protein
VPGDEVCPTLEPAEFGLIGPVPEPADPPELLVPVLGAKDVFGLVGPVGVPADPPAALLPIPALGLDPVVVPPVLVPLAPPAAPPAAPPSFG